MTKTLPRRREKRDWSLLVDIAQQARSEFMRQRTWDKVPAKVHLKRRLEATPCVLHYDIKTGVPMIV